MAMFATKAITRAPFCRRNLAFASTSEHSLCNSFSRRRLNFARAIARQDEARRW